MDLDPDFLEVTEVTKADPLKVFVQLSGDCGGVYVVKSATGFEVIELGKGASSVAFDWRVVARGKTEVP